MTKPTVGGLGVSSDGKLSYTLSEAATVSILLEKKAKGRKVGGKCVKQTKANKAKKSCPLFKPVGKGFAGPGASGPNQVAIPGYGKLKAGSYRLTLTVRDAVGLETVTTNTFKVVAKKKGKPKK